MSSLMTDIITGYSYFYLLYVLIINFGLLLVFMASIRHWADYIREISTDPYVADDYNRPVSVLVYAFNAEESIIDTVESLLDLEYPLYEIVVINDGSSDYTLGKIIEHYRLQPVDMTINELLPSQRVKNLYTSVLLPQLVLADKAYGGQADALNAGINVSRYPLFCAVNANTLVEKNSLLRLATPFMQNEHTVAVTGKMRIANGLVIERGVLKEAGLPRETMVVYEVLEHLKAFLTQRIPWDRLNSLIMTSSLFGMFQKSIVQEVGGYRQTDEDNTELSLRLHEYLRQNHIPYRIIFSPEAFCWTRMPSPGKVLRSHRIRQFQSFSNALWQHKKMFFNPRYGLLGMTAMPYLFITEILGPVFELLAYLCLLLSLAAPDTAVFMALVIALSYLYGLLFSICGVFMEELSYRRLQKGGDLLRLLLLAFVNETVYRPINVFWRMRAMVVPRITENQPLTALQEEDYQ